MQIIRCDASHDALWNAFVEAAPHASFYHRAEWRGINERCFGHRTCYLAALQGGRIVGVFPLVRLSSLMFGTIACSLPFVNYGGPVAEDESIDRALLEAASEVAREWRVDYLEIRSRRDLGSEYPGSDHKVSMTVDLERDPEAVMARYKRDHRYDIRRAAKNGFTVRFGGAELLDDCYEILSESWRDLGTPIFRKDYLRAIVDTFPQSTRLCVAYAEDGTPAAAAFDGAHRDTLEGMWLGTRTEFRKQSVGYVLYWELIKHGCEAGYVRFHLGRSTVESGGEQFKKKWNAHATQLHWHYILKAGRDIPQLNVANPKYRLAMAIWRKLPVMVTQQIGPIIARSIP